MPRGTIRAPKQRRGMTEVKRPDTAAALSSGYVPVPQRRTLGSTPMAKIDGGALLVGVLERAGIDTLFVLHGGHLDAILQAAAERGLRLIDTRHEQAAGHAADAIVCADGGETASWMDMVASVPDGGHWMSHGYLGCLGTGMPFAIAAKVAHPDQPVLCIVGDGSVGLNFAEFDTMVRHDLPIVTVVNNDQLWGMSAHGQDLIYGADRRVVTELSATRYALAAQGFG